MKFAKELDEDLVPEWRVKYLDYKLGKKKIKAVQAAFRKVQKPPKTPRSALKGERSRASTIGRAPENGRIDEAAEERGDEEEERLEQERDNWGSRNVAIPKKAHHRQEESGDSNDTMSVGGTRWRRYGSIIGSPPSPGFTRPNSIYLGDPAMDNDSEDELLQQRQRDPTSQGGRSEGQSPDQRPESAPLTQSPSAFEVGKTRHPSSSKTRKSLGSRHGSQPGTGEAPGAHEQGSRRSNSDHVPFRERISAKHRHMRYLGKNDPNWHPNRSEPLIKRIFSQHGTRPPLPPDVPLEAWEEVNAKQQEFWDFLDQQLEKVETFYRDREEENTKQLETIKRQLHILRDHRMQEVKQDQQRRMHARQKKKELDDKGEDGEDQDGSVDNGDGRRIGNVRNLPGARDAIFHPIEAVKQVQFHAAPKALGNATPPFRAIEGWAGGDYVRKPEIQEHTYQSAKRKLKRAMQEYYRGLELLKSYALLNRTAFRKINKKYDKAISPAKQMVFYHERVNDAWFVRSTLVDEYIARTEDLYARYFYGANRKVAASKLRRKNRLPDAFTRSVFRNGLFLGLGAVLSVEALYRAADDYYALPSSHPMNVTTSYVMQMYGGYFMLLFITLFFCLDARIFHRAKVNYVFIFEFDTHHNLDWRQLSELPCFFFFLMGLIMYLDFQNVGGTALHIWWPVILIGITVGTIFLPARVLYHESRQWFIFSIGRLLTPWRPVEFRDFFLGDIMCSQTYSLGSIELFFYIYTNVKGNMFNHPGFGNSANSRLFGFLTTLPGIIRLLQCFRRYYDTRSKFPHLVNGTKYGCTILQYMSLSIFRINKSSKTRAFFIVCGTLNAIFTSTWDLLIDWSLCDPYSKPPFLRTRRAYKRAWPYYLAMILDVLLRFNWIFYAIPFFSDEIQHSAILGFLVSFSEVFRRGVWTIFRVENEHCTNVGKFKASRDVELPYALSDGEEEEVQQHADQNRARRPTHEADYERHNAPSQLQSPPQAGKRRGSISSTKFTSSPQPMSPTREGPSTSTGVDVEAGRSGGYPNSPAARSLRKRQAQQGQTPSIPSPAQGLASRVGTILQGAHAQDFERRRKSDFATGEERGGVRPTTDEDDDSDNPPTDLEGIDGGGDEDDDGQEGKDAMGPRARARRQLITGAAKARKDTKGDEQTNKREIEEAVSALKAGRGGREESGGSGEEGDSEDEGNAKNPAGV